MGYDRIAASGLRACAARIPPPSVCCRRFIHVRVTVRTVMTRRPWPAPAQAAIATSGDFSSRLLVSSLWMSQNCSSQNHESFCITAPHQVPGLAKGHHCHPKANLGVTVYSKVLSHLLPDIPGNSRSLRLPPTTRFQVPFSPSVTWVAPSFPAWPPCMLYSRRSTLGQHRGLFKDADQTLQCLPVALRETYPDSATPLPPPTSPPVPVSPSHSTLRPAVPPVFPSRVNAFPPQGPCLCWPFCLWLCAHVSRQRQLLLLVHVSAQMPVPRVTLFAHPSPSSLSQLISARCSVLFLRSPYLKLWDAWVYFVLSHLPPPATMRTPRGQGLCLGCSVLISRASQGTWHIVGAQ